MRWLDWVLVAVALGSIAVMLIFYGPNLRLPSGATLLDDPLLP
jgi:hypothetical protein